MKIDNDIEQLVREALAASVAAEPVRFEGALRGIAKSDGVASRSFALAYTVGAVALLTIHNGQRPGETQLRSLAKSFSNSETWTDIDEETASTILTSLADGANPVEDLPPTNAARATYALDGWLLSAFLPDDGSHWNDFLDAILEKVEAPYER